MKTLLKIFILLFSLFFTQYIFAQKKVLPVETKKQLDKKIKDQENENAVVDKIMEVENETESKKIVAPKKKIANKKKAVAKEEPDTVATNTKSTGKILTGIASFYSAKFEGRQTANGEIFSNSKMTCACNRLPLGTWVKVTSVKNGKSIIVKVNDRLAPHMTRVVDLTLAGAKKLDFVSAGLTQVKVEVLKKK